MTDVANEPELLADLAAKSAALAKRLFNVSDELADAFGSELAQQAADDLGGISFYFPKGTCYKVSKLHQDIWSAYNGTNHNQLARQFKVSKVWIYQVVKRMRAADQAKRQPQLFPVNPPSD